MNNLKLVETDVFNEIATCDFWGNANNEYLVTREQSVEHWVIVTRQRL